MVTLPPSFYTRSAGLSAQRDIGNCDCAQPSAVLEPSPIPQQAASDPSVAWADAFTVASVLSTVNNLLGGRNGAW